MKPSKIDNTLFPAVYAAGLAKTIAAEQAHLGFMPDWWQQVVAHLHSQLDKQFPPFDEPETADKWDSDYCRVCGIHKQATHAPWCEYRDGTPVAEIDRMRLFSDLVNDRLNAVEYRTGSLEAFLDFDPKAPADDREPDCIPDLIAEGMTGVTTDCGNQIAALQERLVAMQARLVALESKQPLNPA